MRGYMEACFSSLTAYNVAAGEAQKIDRIMEKFAERYCADNPGVFRSADCAYLLAFALVMLNTDAHNPHADGSLGPDDFVGMCQLAVRCCCCPEQLLKGLSAHLGVVHVKNNPHADGSLGPDDLVGMCQAAVRRDPQQGLQGTCPPLSMLLSS